MAKITPYNILQHELIGLNVYVKSSSDPCIKGVRGKIIDETKNMIIILREDGKKTMVSKKGSVFRLRLPDGTLVEIEGQKIVGRPEDRIKKFVKRKW
ncbi:MAG: ribonuclease P protein component 1 [Candidatus Odinarchaeia archaeon]